MTRILKPAMMARGYVAMPRSIFDDEPFPSEPYSQREAFLFLVAAAAWKPRQERVGRAIVDLERGQVAASTRFLAAKWGWSEAKVRRCLNRLSGRRSSDAPIDAPSNGMSDALIDAVSTRDITVITIRNYDQFNRPAADGSGDSDAPSDAADDAPADAPSVSKSTQRGEGIKEDNSINNIPFAEANGGERDASASNVVVLRRQDPPDGPSEVSPTPAGVLFGQCRRYLEQAAEKTPDQARRIVGSWRKHHSDGQIIDAISRAQRQEAQDPVAFINGCLRQQARPVGGAMSAIAAIEGVRL
ncbi:hypothetical protein [Bradyrhizobium sp. USDA 3315]